MVDINSTILQLSIDEAKIELANLEDRGYSHVILVYPVLKNGEYDFPEIIEKFNILKEEVKTIDIMLGSLIYYHSSIIHRLQKQQILTLNNSNHILITLPCDEKPRLFRQAINELSEYQIILAQPHLCKYFHYKELVEIKAIGVKFLITYDDIKYHIVRRLLKKQMIDFIASGSGNYTEVHKRFQKLISEEYSQRIVRVNYNQIIHKP